MRAALEAGEIDKTRYESYVTLYNEAKEVKECRCDLPLLSCVQHADGKEESRHEMCDLCRPAAAPELHS